MSNIPTDIQQVIRILKTKKLCKTSSLPKIEKDTYYIDKFEIIVDDTPNETRPFVKPLTINFSIHFQYNIKNSILDVKEFNFEVFGFSKTESNVVKSSWHFDYEPKFQKLKYIHPLYHLTYGGALMDDLDIGNVLLLPTPRISYLPMDFVLGVDFILSNFIKKEQYKDVASEPEYSAAVKNSQKRLWQPYFNTLANHWDKTIAIPSNYFKSSDLIPTLQS